MLVRNPYGINLESMDNDKYLEYEEFFNQSNERIFPPFIPPGNQPGPPPGPPGKGPGPSKPTPPVPGSPTNPNSSPGSPPNFTPKQAPTPKNVNQGTYKVSPGSLKPCRYQYVYVWQTNGYSYWAWFTRIDRTTASGYRWNSYRWIYFGVDLNKIESFQCYGREIYRDVDNVISNIETQNLSPSTFNLEYPFISNMETEDVENIINTEIIDTLNHLLENQVFIPEKVDFDKIQSAYEVPLDAYGLLSIVMSLSTLTKGEKRPRTIFDSITVDLNTGKKYSFEDLFNPNSNYKNDISKLAVDISKKLNTKIVVPYDGITDSQLFYLTPVELVLYYQIDEYTPASQGLFRIPIPYNLLTNYLYPESPINKILNPKNIITVPSSQQQPNLVPPTGLAPPPKPSNTNGTAMGPEYLGSYTGMTPEEEPGTAMGPEYLGTYTGVVPEDEGSNNTTSRYF